MNGTPHFVGGIQLVPQNTIAPNSPGDVRYNSSSSKLELYRGTLDSIVTEAGSATLTNKILSGNTAVTLISGSGVLTLNTSGTITIPNSTDTLVGRTTVDTLSNKTLDISTIEDIKDSNFVVHGNADVTRQFKFSAGNISPSTLRNIVIPDANTTLVGTDFAQTLTNKTINAPNNTITNIADTNIASNAAISYSKLALTGQLVDADINASAAIARSKQAALTANRAMVTNGSGFDTISATTDTEIGYVSGVTSPIQAQINGITIVSAPPGMMSMFGGPSAPTGWLFCDGSEVSQTGLYANLFAAIGTTWNTGGEAAGNFRIPNTQGLFPRGAGTQTVAGKSYTSSLAALAVDRFQGHYHTLTDPTHTHPTYDNGHAHTFNESSSGSGSATINGIPSTTANPVYTYSTTNSAAAVIITPNSSTGITSTGAISDGSHGIPNVDVETAPASFGINFMIKY